MSETQKQPLLIRMPNWIGDCVMALSTLNFLEYAGFELTLIGKAWLTDIFGTQWSLIIVKKNDKKSLKKIITQHSAQHLLLLTNSLSSAWLGWCAGKACFGYATDGRRWLLKKSFTKPINKHESDIFLELAQKTAKIIQPQSSKHHLLSIPDGSLPLKHQHTIGAQARKLQKKYGALRSPFILLCPFATGTNKQNQSKIWPQWSQLMAYLSKDKAKPIVCCPGPAETTQAEALEQQGITVIPHLSICDYLAVMSLASCIIGNDTGPMHLAGMVNQHCLTLFGATNPQRTHPTGQRYLGAFGNWPSYETVVEIITSL